jgi:hypothetical protein
MSKQSVNRLDVDMSLQRRGGALLAFGSSLALAGAAMCVYGLLDAMRRWAQQLDEPPTEFARHRWQQMRAASAAASSAGADAWRHAVTSPH